MLKKLIIKQITLEETETHMYPAGFTYPVFMDPETGKYYEPKEWFEVSGEDLTDLFNEIPMEALHDSTRH